MKNAVNAVVPLERGLSFWRNALKHAKRLPMWQPFCGGGGKARVEFLHGCLFMT
jgi:hypothetical protein